MGGLRICLLSHDAFQLFCSFTHYAFLFSYSSSHDAFLLSYSYTLKNYLNLEMKFCFLLSEAYELELSEVGVFVCLNSNLS